MPINALATADVEDLSTTRSPSPSSPREVRSVHEELLSSRTKSALDILAYHLQSVVCSGYAIKTSTRNIAAQCLAQVALQRPTALLQRDGSEQSELIVEAADWSSKFGNLLIAIF